MDKIQIQSGIEGNYIAELLPSHASDCLRRLIDLLKSNVTFRYA